MKDRRKIWWFSVVAAVIFWIADSMIDGFLLTGRISPDLLFGGTRHDLYSRVFLVTCILLYAFGINTIRDNADRKKKHQELREYRERLEKEVAERTEELHSLNELFRKEIIDRTRTEEELSRSENFLATIFDSFHDPFSILDKDYKIIKFNDAYMRLKNRRPRELFGKTCYEVLFNRNSVCEDCVIQKTFQSKDPCAKEKSVTLSDGTSIWIEIYTYPILDQNKHVTHVFEYIRDITARKKAEVEKKQMIENLNYLSTTDGLTGLLNRRALTEGLRREISRAQRYGSDLSLILCDLDKFKRINDTYGHAAGDNALRTVTSVLKKTVRNTDILGRYGGDEFMIILPETSLAGAKLLEEKIRTAVSEIRLELESSKPVQMSISVGTADCCTETDTIDTIVKYADAALYASKQAGRKLAARKK